MGPSKESIALLIIGDHLTSKEMKYAMTSQVASTMFNLLLVLRLRELYIFVNFW